MSIRFVFVMIEHVKKHIRKRITHNDWFEKRSLVDCSRPTIMCDLAVCLGTVSYLTHPITAQRYTSIRQLAAPGTKSQPMTETIFVE